MQQTTLTAEEVAARCRCSPFSVIRWIHSGIRGVRLRGTFAGKWLIDEDDLNAFLSATTAKALGGECPPVPAPVDPPAKRRRRADAAVERMRQEGLI